MATFKEGEIVDNDFLSLFNGKDAVFGKGASWGDTSDWLSSHPDPAKAVYACVMFSYQPKKFLMTGKLASGKTEGQGIDAKILTYLPSMPNNQRGPEGSDVAKRMNGLTLINYAMVDRVAFLALEVLHDSWRVAKGWASRYGARPSCVTEASVKSFFGLKEIPTAQLTEEERKISPNGETARIFWEKVLRFKNDSSYWSTSPLVAQIKGLSPK